MKIEVFMKESEIEEEVPERKADKTVVEISVKADNDRQGIPADGKGKEESAQ